MIPVSSTWAANQNVTLQPEMFVEITYAVTEPGLQEEATASGSSPEDFSDTNHIVSPIDKRGEAYSTLDYGCWGLDGSFSYFDGSPEDPGYVYTGYSNDSGLFAEYPTITIDLEKRHDVMIPGLVITWSDVFGGWATDFRVKALNANGVVAEKTVTGNTATSSVVWLDMVNYSQVTIEILGWSHPYQRPRCMEVNLGLYTVYTKNDLLSFEHSQTADLLSAELPKNEIKFQLRNDDDRWNPDSPSGNEKYLLEQQRLDVRYGMDISGTTEWVEGGTFWLSEWSTPSNGLQADFTARDTIGFMNRSYVGIRVGTLYDIAMAAFAEADLTLLDDGSPRYIVDESLKDISTDFEEDGSDYTIAEILQMVAHAGCCVFYQDRSGIVRIEPRSVKYSGYKIEPAISYAHPEYEISKPLKSISVEYGMNRQTVDIDVESRGEVQTVNNPLLVTDVDALRVGEAAKELLKGRKTVSGDFRADLRMDALDNVIVTSKYASNVLGITEVTYSTTGGGFRGTYVGKVISINLEESKAYSNEFYSGEIW